ncbi:MAG TPA: electron transfer flavoprotein subunit alpha/FixB family protein [Cellulomonas sp.]
MSICIIVGTDAAVAGPVSLARAAGTSVTAVVAGSRALAEAVAAAGVDEVVLVTAGDAGSPGDAGTRPVEALAPAVAAAVAELAPAAVLAVPGDAERVLLGAVVAVLGAPVLAGVTGLEAVDGALVVHRSALNGAAATTEVVTGGPVALVVDALADPVEGAPVAPVREVAATTTFPLTVLEEAPARAATTDLGSATRVVGVGRGLKAQDDLALVEDLAVALGATTACSRPLAEGSGWFPRDRYLGVSGRQIAPDLYLALGISGQVQHMVGVRQARTVVAVNTDKDAAVFAECDYGIVGDLYQVVPALAAALRGA